MCRTPLENFKIIVPSSLIEKVIQSGHLLGAHEGAKRLFLRISRNFFWFAMRRDIALFVMTCDVCDKFKSMSCPPKNHLRPVRVVFRGEVLAMDLMWEK